VRRRALWWCNGGGASSCIAFTIEQLHLTSAGSISVNQPSQSATICLTFGQCRGHSGPLARPARPEATRQHSPLGAPCQKPTGESHANSFIPPTTNPCSKTKNRSTKLNEAERLKCLNVFSARDVLPYMLQHVAQVRARVCGAVQQNGRGVGGLRVCPPSSDTFR
jgi:hypothetical protein